MHPNTLVAGCPSCSVVSPELSFRTPCLIRRHVRRRPGLLRPHVWSCAACCDSTLISRTVKSTYAPCFPIRLQNVPLAGTRMEFSVAEDGSVDVGNLPAGVRLVRSHPKHPPSRTAEPRDQSH